MKTLIAVRHAKSSWEHPHVRDFDRPLNPRGKRDAPIMAAHTRDMGLDVERIYTSPAARAMTTARAFADAFGLDDHGLVADESVYAAGLGELLGAVKRFDQRIETAMLVGHNPGISELAMALTGRDMGSMPTCAVAEIRIDINSWAEIEESAGELISYEYPKKILRR